MTSRVCDEDQERVLHEVEVVGEEDTQSFRLGTMKAVIVFKNEHAQLFAKKIWLSHQDSTFATWLVQRLRQGFLWPSRPIRIEVDSTQPAFLEALNGITIYSHAMEKKPVDWISEPKLTGFCIPLLMGNEEVAHFRRAMEQLVMKWSRDMARGLRPPDHIEPEASRQILETFLRSAGTGGHYYLKIVNGACGFDEVARLWLQLTEDSQLFRIEYIEVESYERRRGFGKRAVALCEAISLLMGFTMRVEIFGENEAAEELFRSTGFVTVAKSFVMTD